MVSYQTLKGINEDNLVQLFSFDDHSSVPTKRPGGSVEAISLGSTSITYTLGLIEILKRQNEELIINPELFMKV